MPYSSDSNDWQQVVNPGTGKPFTSYDEYNQWSTGQSAGASAGAQAVSAASASAKGTTGTASYNWGGTTGSYNDPNSGNIYFGNTSSGGSVYKFGNGIAYQDASGNWQYNDGSGNVRQMSSDEVAFIKSGNLSQQITQQNDPWYYRDIYGAGQSGSGYIDPKTGEIYASGTTGGTAYDPSKDYGLGSSAVGVIPIAHDANGTPTLYYAGTSGGGGKTFSDLSSAEASAQAYQSWAQSEGKLSSTATTSSTSDSSDTNGILTVPGAGENYFDQTSGFYGTPTASSAALAESIQPSNAEQYWNSVQGQFTNPNYLDDYWNQQQQLANTTLDRKAASAGWGDSGASARATGNLGVLYGNQKLLSQQQQAQTGMGLASAADTGKTSATQNWATGVNAASTTDATDLAKMTAGQTAANSAENLLINRETGGLTSATTLANDQAQLVNSGFAAADAQSFATQMQVLQLQVQEGTLTAQQAYTQAQELAQSMSVMSNTALNAYLLTKFPAAKTASTGSIYSV